MFLAMGELRDESREDPRATPSGVWLTAAKTSLRNGPPLTLGLVVATASWFVATDHLWSALLLLTVAILMLGRIPILIGATIGNRRSERAEREP